MKINNPNYLNGLEASASAIDSNINYGILPNAQNFLNYLKGASNISLIGDSIAVGAYNDNNENVFSQRIKSTVDSLLKTKNIGFVTAYSNYQSFPIFHNHVSVGSWTNSVVDPQTLCGFSFKSSTATNTLSFESGAALQNKAKVHYKQQLTACSFEVYVNGTLTLTVNNAGGEYKEIESELFTILPTAKNIILVKVISGTVEVGGVSYFNDTTLPTFDILATGGRRTSYPDVSVFETIASKYDVVFLALGYNDLTSTSAPMQTDIDENFAALFNGLKADNKFLVYLNFGWNTVTAGNWYMDKIDTAMAGYDNYIKIDVAASIVDKDGNKANAEYRYTTLKEWRDTDPAHPNTKGSIRIGDYVKQKLGLNEKNTTQYAVERPYTRLINTSSYGIGTGSNQMTISTAYEIKHANYTEVIANFTHWDLDGYTAIAIIGSENKTIFDYALERRGTTNTTLGFSLAAYNGGVSINRDDAIDGNSPFTLRVRYFN